MTRKKAVCISFILLIIASVILTSVTLTSVSSIQVPVVSLDPLNPVVQAPGDTLMINLTIANVTTMRGINFKLWYNASLLEAERIYPTAITASTTKWLPVNATGQFNTDRPPTINNTMGRVWVAAWGFTSFTGSGALITINFTATAVGNGTLHLNETEVLDLYSDPIAHSVVDGFVTVLPEFPTFIIMPLLLITSLAAAFLGKTFWSRKRKDALIAE